MSTADELLALRRRIAALEKTIREHIPAAELANADPERSWLDLWTGGPRPDDLGLYLGASRDRIRRLAARHPADDWTGHLIDIDETLGAVLEQLDAATATASGDLGTLEELRRESCLGASMLLELGTQISRYQFRGRGPWRAADDQ